MGTGDTTHKHVLIVEDEEPVAELIKLNLEMAGLEASIAGSGTEALSILQREPTDLVLLDIMLPQLDGFRLLPLLSEQGIPVIMLTAKSSVRDKVKALQLGADDYITKPFNGLELVARVQAVLRRTNRSIPTDACTIEGVTVYLDRRQVFRDGLEVHLTPKEFDLLAVLIRHRGQALSREQLLEMVWGYDYAGQTRTVDMHIRRLRQKLQLKCISTVYKHGYRLER